MPLTAKDLENLKKPFGKLIPDSEITREKLQSHIQDAGLVIAVGDATTDRLVGLGILPDISIIDGKERRTKRKYPASYDASEVRCANPKGEISKEAAGALKDALKSGRRTRIIVEGEEDLLALPAIVYAPDKSVVLYGQPLEGLVVVTINGEKRKKAKDLMDRISVD